MTEFRKVTPDLNDPRQNEFVQDYLTWFNKGYEKIDDYSAVEQTIEQLQETYKPFCDNTQEAPQVPYEVQVKQHRIEQLEAVQRRLAYELTTANNKICDLESRIRDAQDILG